MNIRLNFMLTAMIVALTLSAPAFAAPRLQSSVDNVVVHSSTEFVLRVTLEDGSVFDIPVAVELLAEGTSQDGVNAVTVMITPTVAVDSAITVTVDEEILSSTAVTLTQTTSVTTNFAASARTIPPTPVVETPTIVATPNVTATPGITGTAPVTTTPPVTASLPVITGPVTNEISNLRGGPGTDFPIVGSADRGTAIEVVGQNSDGTWYILANGAWIAAFLVENAPVGLPIVESPALPNTDAILVPTPTATSAP